jgi:hypothetical protein
MQSMGRRMGQSFRRGVRSSRLAAAAVLALACGGSEVSACEVCGSGYAPNPYYAPPVYSYSYFGSAYGRARRPYLAGYYTTRINIFRGPRWNYSAAYYNPRPVWRGVHGRPYRGYVRGPVIGVSRRW